MERLNQAAPRVVLSETQASELTRLPGEQHFGEPILEILCISTENGLISNDFGANSKINRNILGLRNPKKSFELKVGCRYDAERCKCQDELELGSYWVCSRPASSWQPGIRVEFQIWRRALKGVCTSFGCLGND